MAMKINHLDAHDRLLVFNKQADTISKGCEECIKNRPEEFQNHPFYIFAHARTDDDGITKRLIWMPRLSKPSAQENSMLFKFYPNTETIKIMWIIPSRELWKQYEKDLMTENETISNSIYMFKHHKDKLEAKDPDDLSESHIDAIYCEIRNNRRMKIKMEDLYPGIRGDIKFKLALSEESQTNEN